MVNFPQLASKFMTLASIPQPEWEHLESLFTTLSFDKGDHIIRAGEASEYLYLIQSGLTRSYYIDQNGKEYNKIFQAENDLASAYVELLNDIPSRINIQALEKTNLLALKFTDLQKLYLRHPCWNELGRKIAENFFSVKEQREYEFLLLDAAQRYENFLENFGKIKDRIPQYHIAAYLGITPVSLSRIINT